MKIRLFEIPEEGKSYKFTRQTAELNEILTDLIGAEAYDAEFTLRPLNSRDYELSGRIRTQSAEACSRCGDDFKFSVNQSFREILIPKAFVDKTGKYSKANHVLETTAAAEVDVIEVEEEIFDVGEYLHEVVAISIPFTPAPEVTPAGDCSFCHMKIKAEAFVYDEPMAVEKKNPFGALKNIKLN